MNKPISLFMETYREIFTNKRLTEEVVGFGQMVEADMLWCVLQGQTEIRLALPVARKLGIPYIAHLWDPHYLWVDAHAVDRISQEIVFRRLAKTFKNSHGIAAASWAMAEQYQRDYGVKAIPIVTSVDSRSAIAPAKKMHETDEFIIGAAGKLYPEEVWRALFNALNTVNWKIGKKNIKIRILSRDVTLSTDGKMNVEFLGWRPQEEAIRLLSGADVLYCPYWFDPYFETVVRLSFPGKLTTFLAAGRPVFFHGPEFASPARFLTQNDAGIICNSIESSVIVETLSKLISNPDLYARLSENGRKAFDKYLTLDSMRRYFAELLGVEEDLLKE